MGRHHFDIHWDDDTDISEPCLDHRIEEEVRPSDRRRNHCGAAKYRPEMCGVPWKLCPRCNEHDIFSGNSGVTGNALCRATQRVYQCPRCKGTGYLNVPTDDESMNQQTPGSEAAVVIKAARYSRGLSLWS